jgi:MFS family permease
MIDQGMQGTGLAGMGRDGSVEAEERAMRRRAVRCIYLARALRDCGDGLLAVLLPVYLTALGFSALQVGLIATLSLCGSAIVTLAVSILGAPFGLRRLLIAGSSLMAASGMAYASCSDYAVLALVAFVGTINPSAGSVSLFIPLEQALLAGRVADHARTRAFARYGLIGALAGAFGALGVAVPELLETFGMGRLVALKAMFLAYAALGVAGGACYTRIPKTPPAPGTGPRRMSLGPSRAIIYRLAALFSLDAFAGGFIVQSLLALWLFEQFDLSLAAAGVFFFWSGLLAAASYPVAAWLARRIGLVNTMVFTHIPSSLCLILAAAAPALVPALVLLLMRAALSQMDVPTRTSYVMALVGDAERAAAASITAVPRSLAAALSPALAGALYAASYRALPLIICGSLKLLYDLLLILRFSDRRPPEEQRT